MEIKMHKKIISLPPCLVYNIRKPQTALKLISKKRKPFGCVKPQYRSFCKIAQKNRAKPYHSKPVRPLQHHSSVFFYRHATIASYRIPGELQGLYTGDKGERERATVELKLARNRPEPSVPIRKKKQKTKNKKKKTLGPRVGLPVVFNTFLFASREFT